MKNKSFLVLPAPLIVGSLRQRTGTDVIEDIRLSEKDGAKAFIHHLQLLDECCLNEKTFENIASSTACPVMAIFYKKAGQTFSDTERLNVCERAVKSGYSAVDLPVFLFDENPLKSIKGCPLPFALATPNEVTMDKSAVKKQIQAAEKFKKSGAQVLFSAHVGVELSCNQAISLAKEIESRGADIVKIVTACHSPEQAIEILKTNLELKKQLKVKFYYGCSGYYGRLIRRIAPLFGTMLVFGHHSYNELSNREKPIIKELVQYYELNRWSFDGSAE